MGKGTPNKNANISERNNRKYNKNQMAGITCHF